MIISIDNRFRTMQSRLGKTLQHVARGTVHGVHNHLSSRTVILTQMEIKNLLELEVTAIAQLNHLCISPSDNQPV